MSTLDSIKKGSGKTVIGGAPTDKAHQQSKNVAITPLTISATKPASTVIGSATTTNYRAEEKDREVIKPAPAVTEQQAPVQPVKLPPRPETPFFTTRPTAPSEAVPPPAPKEVVIDNTVYESEKRVPLATMVTQGARKVFTDSQAVSKPVEESLSEIAAVVQSVEKMVLPEINPAALEHQLESIPTPGNTTSDYSPANPPLFKIEKTRKSRASRVPIYASLLALTLALSTVAVSWYYGDKTNLTGAQAADSSTSSSSQSSITSPINVTTYLAKNSLDPNKVEATSFKRGEPIQVCINYSSQPSTSIIEIKITRTVDAGSQLEIISTKLNAVGTDVRCLPFTGVQATEGAYTVTLANATDVSSPFKKVGQAIFNITAADAASSSSASISSSTP